MPSTPTTKSQVQAYRFVLRRMQSALVRKDAVMLHDPMRTHTRATVVGVCIAAIGMVGFLIWGLLSPKPGAPDSDGIVIGKPSGAVYVLITKPERKLIPTFNLASARLLLLAQQTKDQQQQQGGSAAGIPDGSAPSGGPAEPQFLDDKELNDIPRERLTGIQNGPQFLPNNDQRIEPRWAVCDQFILRSDLPNDGLGADSVPETTVLGGVQDLGQELNESTALLVQADNGVVYLVYRTPATANRPNDNAVRAPVDLGNSRTRSALRLKQEDVRRITTGMLNTIPEAEPLKPPTISGRGEDSQHVQGRQVGDVLGVERAGGQEFYVVLADGVQRIKETTADLIRFTRGDQNIPQVEPQVITNVPTATETIPESTFPDKVPEVLNARNFPVACLGWSVVGEGSTADEHTAVHVGNRIPGVPRDAQDRPLVVNISTPSADGQKIAHFYMPPGRAGVVRSASSKQEFTTGTIILVSDRGVKYGIPDDKTAAALGLSDQKPAPLNIMKLLPDGASLNTRDVLQTYDSVPVQQGSFESSANQPGGGSGSGQAGGAGGG